MITVDIPALNQSLNRWNSYVAGKIDMIHKAGPAVVKVEAGRLVQTLIKVTPPGDPQAVREKIEEDVGNKFTKLGWEHPHSFDEVGGSKGGKGDVRWYAWSPQYLFGVAKDQDMTNASVEELRAAYYGNSVKDRDAKQIYEFNDTSPDKLGFPQNSFPGHLQSWTVVRGGKTFTFHRGKEAVWVRKVKYRVYAGQHGRQRVLIWKRILTNRATVLALTARLKRNVGRLKAGWCPSWDELGQPGGVYSPPEWVTRHNQLGKVRGYAINGLGDPRFPQFTLENHAKGAGSAKMNDLVRRALDIRSEAMVKRLTFLLKHPEKIQEEVNGPAED